MSQSSAKSARFLWKNRFLLCALVFLITLTAAQQLASLSVSNSLEIWYPEDDPELVNYREFQNAYGSDEIIVVAVSYRDDSVFTSDESVYLVGELTDRLLDLESVATVTSLVTVPESLASVRGRLLSADGKTTALIVQPTIGADAESRRAQLLTEIRKAVDAHGLDTHLGGYGVVFEGLNEASTTGAAELILAAHLLMIFLLAFSFRRALPVFVTLISVGLATIWTMGLYAATGHQLHMVTMVLPTLVLVIGIADCMHVLRSVAEQDANLAQNERVIAGLGESIGPCFLTSATTAAGFLGLAASGLPAVQQLGWFGAAGMVAAFICSMVIVTAALSWPGVEPVSRRMSADTAAASLCDFGTRRFKPVLAVFLLLAAIAGYGIGLLNVDTGSIGYLKKSHPVRQDSDFIERQFGAYVPIEFTVTAEGDVLTTQNLDAIWAWQKAALQIPKIEWSWSLVSAFDLATTETPTSVGIQRLSREINRMQQFSPTTFQSMVSGAHELRVSFGAPILSSVAVQSLIEEIQMTADFPFNLTLKPAGYAPLYTRIIDEIVMSQVRGFASAIVLIVILLGIGMRSWRRVLLALPANAIPVALTLGLMGLSGIPLDVASATIASVILGLVVDDTVHILRPAPGASLAESLRLASRKSGGTLVMTSVILAGGFLVLGLAEIRSIAWFGVLTSFAVIAAILTDLLLLPALVRLFSMPSGRTSGAPARS
ncbi:MAG: MMPL family transporter [Proteobacteria bacterium]|nr:MMPL family transporter [Pseudomonadota bacterium]